MQTAWERFHRATLSLARSGPIKERLTAAYREYLADLESADLPKEVRADFEEFMRAITRERPVFRGEDAVRATVRKMSNEDADRCASSIVEIYGALPRTGPPIAARQAQVVHLFAEA